MTDDGDHLDDDAEHPDRASKLSSPAFARVYDELRSLARARLARGHGATSIQATAIVHDVWLRLADAPELEDTDESHYFAVAAQAMRWILIDRARRRRTTRASSSRIDRVEDDTAEQDEQLLALDGALARFERAYPRKAAVVTHRFFAGLSVEDTARVLGTSTATVKREWSFARAWLLRELGPDFAAPFGNPSDS